MRTPGKCVHFVKKYSHFVSFLYDPVKKKGKTHRSFSRRLYIDDRDNFKLSDFPSCFLYVTTYCVKWCLRKCVKKYYLKGKLIDSSDRYLNEK